MREGSWGEGRKEGRDGWREGGKKEAGKKGGKGERKNLAFRKQKVLKVTI